MMQEEKAAAEYLAAHVYPTLEPCFHLRSGAHSKDQDGVQRASQEPQYRQYFNKALEELLKLAFPPEDFRISSANPPKPFFLADSKRVVPPPTSKEGEETAGVENAPQQPQQPQQQHVSLANVVSKGNFPGGKPLVWLAQYLKARNKQNTREAAERHFEQALELAGTPVASLGEHYKSIFEALRHILWPCSAYISRRTVISRALPKRVKTPASEPREGEPQEDAPEPPPDEARPATPVEYEDVEVLKYEATSHPMGSEAIEGWALEYRTNGVTGRVIEQGDGAALFISDVAAEPGLFWFAGKPSWLMGSYFAVPLVDRNRNVWGVLSVDTVLDGRQLTAADTDKVLAVVRRATPVLFELVAREEEEMLRAAAERESRMGGGGEEEATGASSVLPVNEDE